MPCAFPRRNGVRISSPPVALQSASVRTAETTPLGASQHESTLTAAHAQMEKMVWASGRYRLASLKSTTESSTSKFCMRLASRRAYAVRINQRVSPFGTR